jgi:membrane protease YdiL (CAAX protease family)
MARDESGNFRAMDEPKDNLPGELDKVFSASPPPAIAPGAGPGFALSKLSPFEDRMQKIFLGRNGLRPIWRLVLYLLMYRALRFCLFVLLAYGLPDTLFLWRQTAAELGLAIIVLAPALPMSRIEGRAFGCYGLPLGKAFGKLFWVGALWGMISLTLLLLALRGAHAFYIGTAALHGLRALKFALFWAGFFLIVGFYEEFFTRGYTQFALTEAVGFWPAAILLSLGFGALHLGNPGEYWVGILGAMVIGFFFCLTLRRTGNLWFAVGFHAAWDWGESYFYSVPDSGGMAPGHLLHSSLQGPRWLTGGSVGPEGSVFLFILLMLLWMVFGRVYPTVKYPPAQAE